VILLGKKSNVLITKIPFRALFVILRGKTLSNKAFEIARQDSLVELVSLQTVGVSLAVDKGDLLTLGK
jgi:hypothetical protein